MSIANVNNMLVNAYQYAERGRRTERADNTTFLERLNEKADSAKNVNTSLKDMWQTRFPGAYYNVMDTSKIDGSLWGRNDYPWDKYFSNNIDDSVLDWKPSGAEPAMSDPKVQAKIRSTLGKKSIIVPPALEEKMKNNPELAQKVMTKVENFIAANDAVQIHRAGYFPNPNKGYLIAFDENGEIAHSCITSESMSVSSSEFVEARKARDAKHAEYERLAEEAALKRRLMEQEADERYYKSSVTKKAVFAAAYEQNIMEASGILK